MLQYFSDHKLALSLQIIPLLISKISFPEMADAAPSAEDAALAELLDSALADFDTSKESPAAGDTSKPTSDPSKTEKNAPASKPSAAPSDPSEAAAADLLGNLQQLYEGLQTEAKTEGGPESSEVMFCFKNLPIAKFLLPIFDLGSF